MKKLLSLVTVLVLTAIMTGCAQNISPNTYQTNEVGVATKVKKGVVLSKRTVNIDNKSGVGGVAGAVGGAAAGSTLGSGASTNVIGAVGGAVIGGLLGNAIDKGIHNQQGIEYIVKLENGDTISITQAPDMQFSVNQRVLVVYGAMTRLIPDDTPITSTKRKTRA